MSLKFEDFSKIDYTSILLRFGMIVHSIMIVPQHIFRAYDIRGLLAEVTPEIAERVGVAFIEKTNAKKVIVGRDMRSSSPQLHAAVIKGVTSMGAQVIDIGLCTTPMYSFAVTSDPSIEGGLMITASHNPAAYNGIKMADSTGLPISGLAMLPLVEAPLPLLAEQAGSVTQCDIMDNYLAACLKDFDPEIYRGLKVVVDYGNGMGALAFRPLCERLGIDLVELYPEPDANFPNHEANPAIAENLHDLTAAVLANQAEIGIALDGDADRIAFMDNEGVPIRGDQMLAFLAKDLLKREPGAKIVTAPNQSWSTTDAILGAGGEVIESRIGRTLAIMAIRNQGAVLGGEVSSHFFFRETEGLERSEYTFLRAVRIWRETGLSLADAVRDLRVYHNSWEVNIEVKDKAVALQALEDVYAATATVVNRLDGIRCEFDRDWWFIVRPSNNEPLIRITVEAKSEALMVAKRDEIVALLSDK